MKLHKLTSGRWDFEGVGDHQIGFKVHDNKSWWGAFLKKFRLSFRDEDGNFVSKKSFKHYKSRITDPELQKLIAGKSTQAAFVALKNYNEKDNQPAIAPSKKLPKTPQKVVTRSNKGKRKQVVATSSQEPRLMQDFDQDFFNSILTTYYTHTETLDILSRLARVSKDLNDKVRKTRAQLLSRQAINLQDLPGNIIKNTRAYSPNIRNLLLCRNSPSNLIKVNKIVKLCPNLETLELRNFGITSNLFTQFAKPDKLSSLKFSNCKGVLDLVGIVDQTLSKIDLLKNLTSLRFERCKCDFSDQSLEKIANVTTLRDLQLDFCRKITDKGLALVATKLPELTKLSLQRCKVTDDGLAHVAKLTKLTKLNLNGCWEVTYEGLASIADKLSNLIDLDLGSCNTTDRSLAEIAKLTQIARLNLGSCARFTENGLIGLVDKITDLTLLKLAYCPRITDNGVAKVIAKFTNLTSLNLGWCNNITDNGLAEIAQLNSLTYLNITNCAITDHLLPEIAKLQNLAELGLHNGQMRQASLDQFTALTKGRVKLKTY